MSQPRLAYSSTTPRGPPTTPSNSAPDTALHIEYAGDSASSSPGAAESTAAHYAPRQGYLLFHAAADRLRRGTSSPMLATESPDALQHTIVALRAQLDAQRAENEQQAAEIKSLRRENEGLRDDIVDADIENDGLFAEVKALRRQRDYFLDDAEAESMRRDFDAGLKDREIDRLQVLLRHASNVHDERMREKIESSAALSSSLRAELGATRAGLEKRCAGLESTVARVEALESTVATKEARIQELATMYAATSDVNGHYYRSLNLARFDNVGLEAQLERARGEIGRLEGVVGAAREYFDSLHRIREEMRELAERIWGRREEEEEDWEDVVVEEEEEEEDEEDALDGDFVEV